MVQLTDLQALGGVGGLTVVLGLVALLKGFVSDKRWYPVLALAGGVAWNLLLAAVLGQRLGPAIVLGLLVGLMASGLYSGQKALRGQ